VRNRRRIAEDNVHDIESGKTPLDIGAAGVFPRGSQHALVFFGTDRPVGCSELF